MMSVMIAALLSPTSFRFFVLVHAARYTSTSPCTVDQMAVVLLYRDPDSGNFTVVERLGNRPEVESMEAILQNDHADPTLMNATRDQFRFLQASDYDSLNDQITDNYWKALEVTDDERQRETARRQLQQIRNRQLSLVTDNSTANSSFEGYADNSLVTANSDIGSNFFYVRECACFTPWNDIAYCPFVINSCLRNIDRGRSTWGSDTKRIPGCRNIAQESSYAFGLLMASIAWFVVLALCLVSPAGTGAFFRDYIINCFYTKWTEKVADRILHNNPNRARALLRSNFIHTQAVIERSLRRAERLTAAAERRVAAPDRTNTNSANLTTAAENTRDEGGDPTGIELQTLRNGQNGNHNPGRCRPSSLALKVRTYHPFNDHSCKGDPEHKNHSLKSGCHGEDIDEEAGDHPLECTICFSGIQDGDRVGELRCQHIFHASCLKQWLKRKNVCPLCQCKEIAEPRYEDVDKTDEAKNEERSRDDSEQSSPTADSSTTSTATTVVP
jgi:hypothetical protein